MSTRMNTRNASNGATKGRADTFLQRTWNRWEDYTEKKGRVMTADHLRPLNGK